MLRKVLPNLSCPDPKCTIFGQFRKASIVRHGSFRLKRGRRRRFRYTACGRTSCSTAGTPDHRIPYARNAFDEVAPMAEHIHVGGRRISFRRRAR